MDDGLPQVDTDDVSVIIEGDPDAVTQEGGATIIKLDDGSVVVQTGNEPEAGSKADEDPKKFYRNLADDIEQGKLDLIAEQLMEEINADDNSRKGTLENRRQGLALLGLSLEQPTAGVGDSASGAEMSVVTNPLLLDACLRSWANSNAELLPSDGPCKIENESDDETAPIDKLAEAFEKGMNYYLTTIASEYYPDTSHMLLWGNTFGGSGIKKVFIDPQLRRPSSQSVDIKDLIVSDTTKDLKSCQRITHVITMRPSVLKRLQMKGYYRDFPLAPATQPEPNAVDEKVASIQGTTAMNHDARPEDMPYTFFETQCELNLPEYAPKEFGERGIQLPFLVTIEKDSRAIMALRRDWKPEDEDCVRKQMYVKYPYVPGPGFYGTGLLNILGNASAAMTAAWRMSLDAGMYAMFPGGIYAEGGGRQKSMTLRPSPGEFTPIQTNGMALKDVIDALPYKGVDANMIALIQEIEKQAKSVGGAIEIPVKEGVKDIPVGTMLAYVEQAAQVMLAAHKGMHTAQSEELMLIADLFREDPESFWRTNKKAKKFWNEEKLLQALETYTLVPKSDPNVPSHVHRLMKAVALIQLGEVPMFAGRLNPDEILRRVLSALKEDPNGLVQAAPPQQAPPDLKGMAAIMKEENNKEKNQIDALNAAQEGEIKHNQNATEIEGKRIDLAKAAIQHAGDNKDRAHQQHMDHKGHALDVAKHGLDVITAIHDMGQAQQENARADHGEAREDREQAVNEHTALNPPEPAGKT